MNQSSVDMNQKNDYRRVLQNTKIVKNPFLVNGHPVVCTFGQLLVRFRT